MELSLRIIKHHQALIESLSIYVKGVEHEVILDIQSGEERDRVHARDFGSYELREKALMKDMGVKIPSASKRRAHSKKNYHPTEAMTKRQKTAYEIKFSKEYYDDMALQLMFKHIEYVVPDKRGSLGRGAKPLLACSISYLEKVREHIKKITERSRPGDKDVAKDLEPEEH